MKTQQELKDYANAYNENLYDDRRDLEDDFNPRELLIFLKTAIDPEILFTFDLKPVNLARIVNAIGGAEYYRFEDIKLFEILRALYPFKPKDGPIYDAVIDWTDLAVIIRELFPKYDKPTPGNLALDKALGHLIHIEHFLILQEYLDCPPSGDDTYFDYYPGNISYIQEITQWFLNSNNRMT